MGTLNVQIDAAGITIDLLIKGYRKSTKDNWDELWCRCDFSFTSNNWLNYKSVDNEVLLSCEIEELEQSLTKLLDGKITEKIVIEPIEPDFKFILFPEEDLRNNPNYTYVQPGYEILDIHLEWQVYFWSGGLTDNFLTVTLGRKEIVRLRDYLRSVIGLQ